METKDRAELRSLYLSRLDQFRRQRTQEKELERLAQECERLREKVQHLRENVQRLREQKHLTQEREAALALAEQEKTAREAALSVAAEEKAARGDALALAERERAECERLREMLLQLGVDPEKS